MKCGNLFEAAPPPCRRREKRMRAMISVALCLCVSEPSSPESQIEYASSSVVEMADPSSEPESSLPTADEYISSVVEQCLEEFYDPAMSEYEKTKAAFDYLIEKGTFSEPIGFDVWRLRSYGGDVPGYLENRSLSLLVFGRGACEDYASALYMLLTAMGLKPVFAGETLLFINIS